MLFWEKSTLNYSCCCMQRAECYKYQIKLMFKAPQQVKTISAKTVVAKCFNDLSYVSISYAKGCR